LAAPTLGVEEEYHLVDPETLGLVNSAELSERAAAGTAGAGLRAEMLTSQLEAATEVCADLDQLRREIVAMRSTAAAAAAELGATILASSTHPFASLREIQVMDHPRYAGLIERFGTIVTQFNLVGCHVHVSVPNLETAVAVMNHARPYLPVLAALTGSSPFHEGIDTGFESFRLPWLALWPQGGPPPYLASASEYSETIADNVSLGLIADASAMLWDVRPSARYPTIEFRAADVCTEIDDVVLYAGVVRSLVRVLETRVASGAAAPPTSETTLRAARWRAARYGLRDRLWSPTRGQLAPAAVVVDDLIAELRSDLETHDELSVITDLLAGLRSRGTSATQQRRRFATTGSLLDVTRELVTRTTSRN
jgi:carboxylate-amine ligase